MLLLSVTSHTFWPLLCLAIPRAARVSKASTGNWKAKKPSTDSSALLQVGQTPLFKNIQSLPNDHPASHWGKLCHQPQVMSLYPLALFQGHTKIGAFLLLPSLQSCCLLYGKQEVFLYLKKIAAIALILLAVSYPFVSLMDDL